jgi:hypothetical protein
MADHLSDYQGVCERGKEIEFICIHTSRTRTVNGVFLVPENRIICSTRNYG